MPPEVDLKELLLALREVMDRAALYTHHEVAREALSVRERMSRVLERLTGDQFIAFTSMFDVHEGRSGVVVTFLAILELLKAQLIELVQNEPLGEIHLKAA